MLILLLLNSVLVLSGLQIIERALPKKPKVKKDPAVIEREEMEKIGKVWANIVKKDLPKHHRIFTAFHRKQLIDAKRFVESCQKEASIILFGPCRFTNSIFDKHVGCGFLFFKLSSIVVTWL